MPRMSKEPTVWILANKTPKVNNVLNTALILLAIWIWRCMRIRRRRRLAHDPAPGYPPVQHPYSLPNQFSPAYAHPPMSPQELPVPRSPPPPNSQFAYAREPKYDSVPLPMAHTRAGSFSTQGMIGPDGVYIPPSHSHSPMASPHPSAQSPH